MKMAEQPSDVTVETPPTMNDDTLTAETDKTPTDDADNVDSAPPTNENDTEPVAVTTDAVEEETAPQETAQANGEATEKETKQDDAPAADAAPVSEEPAAPDAPAAEEVTTEITDVPAAVTEASTEKAEEDVRPSAVEDNPANTAGDENHDNETTEETKTEDNDTMGATCDAPPAANGGESHENVKDKTEEISTKQTVVDDDDKPPDNVEGGDGSGGEAKEVETQGNTDEGADKSGSAPAAEVVGDHEAEDKALLPDDEQPNGSETAVEAEAVDAAGRSAAVQETPLEDQDISTLNEDQLRERYEVLRTKHVTELNSLRDQNAELRAKIQRLEDEKLLSSPTTDDKTRQRDGLRVQADYLANELSQTQDTEKYLREKLAEVLEEKAESERKVKDLQLRLKRFIKDDMAKDERVARLEAELREISQEVQQMETYLDEESLRKVQDQRKSSDRTAGQNGAAGGGARPGGASPTPQSKACVIL